MNQKERDMIVNYFLNFTSLASCLKIFKEMVDEFQNLLRDKSQTFSLHESVVDSEGKEKFLKVNKDEVAT